MGTAHGPIFPLPAFPTDLMEFNYTHYTEHARLTASYCLAALPHGEWYIYWGIYIPFYWCLAWFLLGPYIQGTVIPGFCGLFTYYSLWYCQLRGKDLEQAKHTAIRRLAKFWQLHARIFHGHKIFGLENIPEKGPVMLIYYHGAFPIDLYYLNAEILLEKKRHFYTIVDRFMFKMPTFSLLLPILRCFTGSRDECVQRVRSGEGLFISPGGAYEALFSDCNYPVMWKKRKGFAHIVHQTKVPVIPFFTKNIRETCRFVGAARWFWALVYTISKLPLVPLYGAWPVKLTTFVGKPVNLQRNSSVDEIAEKVQEALELLIKQHQPLPGSMTRALLERIR